VIPRKVETMLSGGAVCVSPGLAWCALVFRFPVRGDRLGANKQNTKAGRQHNGQQVHKRVHVTLIMHHRWHIQDLVFKDESVCVCVRVGEHPVSIFR